METVTLIILNVIDLPWFEHYAKPLGECLHVAQQNVEQKCPSALMLILAGCKCISQVRRYVVVCKNMGGECQTVKLILKLLANRFKQYRRCCLLSDKSFRIMSCLADISLISCGNLYRKSGLFFFLPHEIKGVLVAI